MNLRKILIAIGVICVHITFFAKFKNHSNVDTWFIDDSKLNFKMKGQKQGKTLSLKIKI